MQPTIGSTVRAVSMIGTGLPRTVYAAVLGVSPLTPDNLGSDGEPTLTLAFMDDPSVRKLGGPDWHQEFERHAGVRHSSHPDVAAGRVSIAWVQALPAANEAVDISPLNGIEVFPIHDAPALTAGEKEPAYPNNIKELRGETNKLAMIENLPGQHSITNFVVVARENLSPANLLFSQIKSGDYLPDLKMTVTDVNYGDDGNLYIHTRLDEGVTTVPLPDGSGTERYPEGHDWTKVEGEGLAYPGEPTGGIAAGDAARHDAFESGAPTEDPETRVDAPVEGTVSE